MWFCKFARYSSALPAQPTAGAGARWSLITMLGRNRRWSIRQAVLRPSGRAGRYDMDRSGIEMRGRALARRRDGPSQGFGQQGFYFQIVAARRPAIGEQVSPSRDFTG